MEEKEKADEYIIGKDGELIGIAWSENNPKKLLERLNQLEERVKKLEVKVDQ